MKTDQQLAASNHFRLQQLADGVYAAIHVDGGAAVGNAGIVDLSDRRLIYDTFFTPQTWEDLRTAAEALTGHPIDAVINSHFHNDHIRGAEKDADSLHRCAKQGRVKAFEKLTESPSHSASFRRR